MSKDIIKNGLRNVFFVVISQLTSFILGVIRSLALPILLGVTNFGYWQVYMLYVSYVGVFSIGFNDGIYLRYGNYEYGELPKKVFRSSIKIFMFVQLIIMAITIFCLSFESNINKQYAMLWSAINIPIIGLSGTLIYIFQITNQLKKYSVFTIFDKLFFVIFVFWVYIFDLNSYILIIAFDTLSRILLLLLMIYSCRDIVFGKGCGKLNAVVESWKNVSIGIKLMIANLAGMLVLGFGRFLIERFESVEIYGAYSFSISTMNLVLIFVSAIGLVVYPTLCRLNTTSYAEYFIQMNDVIVNVLLLILVMYFPLCFFILNYMEKYSVVLQYLPIIFAIIFIQGKMQILINPYYKLLREEKAMLKANVIGLIMAVGFIVPAFFLYRSVLIVAVGTFFSMILRLYLSEIYLKKKLLLRYFYNIKLEAILLSVFVLCAYQCDRIIGFAIYLSFFCLYLMFNRRNLFNHLKILYSYKG